MQFRGTMGDAKIIANPNFGQLPNGEYCSDGGPHRADLVVTMHIHAFIAVR